jgi:hypothetical protein
MTGLGWPPKYHGKRFPVALIYLCNNNAEIAKAQRTQRLSTSVTFALFATMAFFAYREVGEEREHGAEALRLLLDG